MIFTSIAAPAPTMWSGALSAGGDEAARNAVINREIGGVPLALRPAADFEKILIRIYSGTPVTQWRGDLVAYIDKGGKTPVDAALRELALCWEARARMQEIDAVLRGYYKEEVRFPDELEALKSQIPESARTDPWGGVWQYKASAPAGFGKLANQRYQLTPARFPEMLPIKATIHAAPSGKGWTAALKKGGTSDATVEIRAPQGGVALIQVGGQAGGATLAYIGDGWILLADSARLFTLPL